MNPKAPQFAAESKVCRGRVCLSKGVQGKICLSKGVQGTICLPKEAIQIIATEPPEATTQCSFLMQYQCNSREPALQVVSVSWKRADEHPVLSVHVSIQGQAVRFRFWLSRRGKYKYHNQLMCGKRPRIAQCMDASL